MDALSPMAIDEALHLAKQPIPAHHAAAKAAFGGINFAGGLIDAPVHGRTDKIPLNIPSGSYVLPADIVSAIGQGNTMAGAKTIQEVMKDAHNAEANTSPSPNMKSGGKAGLVPIIAAGGEYILTPEECRWLGKGDTDKGHRDLDRFVVETRSHLRKTLAKLKPPKRD